MTGPGHYREGERLIAAGEAVVKRIGYVSEDLPDYRERRDDLGKQAMGIWAQAQAHFAAAQAAATALGNLDPMPIADGHAWVAAVGEPRNVPDADE